VRIFLAGTSFHPEYGGPAHSVSRLAVALTAAGGEVGLWSPDQSAATTPLLPQGSGVQRLTGPASEALRVFGRTDVLHDNGIWWLHNHRLAGLAAARDIPRVVSTRGMLQPWAVDHKRLKKRFAWWLYQQRDLTRAQCHHATSEPEAVGVRRLGLDVPVHVIPNGVDVPVLDRVPDRTSTRRALFIGRIYPVKGLPMLVEAWARVRPEGWRLHIAGPDEAGHRAAVERAVRAAGLDAVVSFEPMLDDRAKRAAMLAADLFVVPSQSESFGMAIGEALAHGLPVLTTTAVPWPALPEWGCGWRVEPAVEAIAGALREATALDGGTLRAMGSRGRAMVSKECGWDRVAQQFITTYEGLLR
jgi:glycosyltransferase involved in cell wall biosynthesis